MSMLHCSTGCLLALIALAAGYIVLAKANKQTQGLKTLGIVIGTIIIVGTLLISACRMVCCIQSGQCPILKGSFPCPISSAVNK